MDERTQREIARGLREGSRQAWLGLYDAYAERVWREVARLMGPASGHVADHVADVVQETFLSAARSARGFDPKRGSLWAWLSGIARRQVALHYRQHRRFEDLERARQWWVSLNGQKTEWVAAEADAPPDVLEARELATLVRRTLAELPADYQMLLTAKYMDEASAEQIAIETNSSHSAVRSKLARARGAFRRMFSRITRAGRMYEEVRP